METVEHLLNLPFDNERDEVLKGKVWTPVLERLPTWTSLCGQAAASARHELSQSEVLAAAIKEGLDSAAREVARRLAILEARTHKLPTEAERMAADRELERERSAAEALKLGIREPMIRMVACGACVLWPEADF